MTNLTNTREYHDLLSFYLDSGYPLSEAEKLALNDMKSAMA